jgi:hypothetical protein
MLYVDNASVVATFDTLADAMTGLNGFVAEHPEIRDDVAVLELDAEGRGTGDYLFADAHSALFAG